MIYGNRNFSLVFRFCRFCRFPYGGGIRPAGKKTGDGLQENLWRRYAARIMRGINYENY